MHWHDARQVGVKIRQRGSDVFVCFLGFFLFLVGFFFVVVFVWFFSWQGESGS